MWPRDGARFSCNVAFIATELVRQLLEHRICLHFLLNEVAQLKQRRLENEQALLQLRRQNVLQRKILCLMHSLWGHTPSLPAQPRAGKQFSEHFPANEIQARADRSPTAFRSPFSNRPSRRTPKFARKESPLYCIEPL